MNQWCRLRRSKGWGSPLQNPFPHGKAIAIKLHVRVTQYLQPVWGEGAQEAGRRRGTVSLSYQRILRKVQDVTTGGEWFSWGNNSKRWKPNNKNAVCHTPQQHTPNLTNRRDIRAQVERGQTDNGMACEPSGGTSRAVYNPWYTSFIPRG